MKVLSWNVNGLRSISRKGVLSIVKDYDVVMLQEIRSQDLTFDVLEAGFEVYAFPAARKGYSGVLTMSRSKPLKVIKGLGVYEFDVEGRVLTLEFDKAYLINAYFPRAGDDLSRLSFKLRFCEAFIGFVKGLMATKPVVACGDFNVARDRLDSSFWDEKHPGLTREERECFSKILGEGLVDSFRLIHPNARVYSWRSFRERWRAMRIDYCLVSEGVKDRVSSAEILTNVQGSDHYPVALLIDL